MYDISVFQCYADLSVLFDDVCRLSMCCLNVFQTCEEGQKSTAVGQVVACATVMQRARVRSPVRTSFLGEVFSGFFLTCKTNVRKL